MSGAPTAGALPGAQWKPSNGTVGDAFIDDWCGSCQRDRAMREGVDIDDCHEDERCQILGASFRGEAVEWREIDGQIKCIAWVAAGQPIPTPRCDKTLDLFGGVA